MTLSLRSLAPREMRLLAELGPVAVASGGWLMAQASGLDPSLANLIGNGVTVAVLCWYVVYDIRVRNPNMLAAFTREQEEIRKAFKEEQAGSRETFHKTLETVRSVFSAEQSALRLENREDRRMIREAHALEISEWRKMVLENMTAMRTAVHDVKDTAQLVITGREHTAATVPKQTGDLAGSNPPSRPS